MFKTLLGLALSIGLLSFNTAWARSYLSCNWESTELVTAQSFHSIITSTIQQGTEKGDCKIDQNGKEYCEQLNVWKIPNRIYTLSQPVKITCVNIGDKTEEIMFNFTKASEKNDYSILWKNLTFSISGAGSQKTFSNLDSMPNNKSFMWSGPKLAPCQKNCVDMATASPRYTTNLTFTFRVQPRVFTSYFKEFPFYDLQNSVGALWITSAESNDPSWTQLETPYMYVCGLAGKKPCDRIGGGGGGGGSRPPIKQCTLTIVSPDVVAFQPISSDDLSRNRVRTEDFTLTAIKGPDQATPCLGSAYNLPGTIKTEGGYAISSTFWGISHSSGAPQGIGLKLYDLGKGNYLQFNHTYPSFISNISSISESKRIRAEISATTTDLKKIKDGEYSQVLTFEVKMP